MPLSAIDLTVLIEMVEKELYSLHAKMDDIDIPERERDDCAEMSVVMSVIAGNLQDEYEVKRRDCSNLREYEDLITDIGNRLT